MMGLEMALENCETTMRTLFCHDLPAGVLSHLSFFFRPFSAFPSAQQRTFGQFYRLSNFVDLGEVDCVRWSLGIWMQSMKKHELL